MAKEKLVGALDIGSNSLILLIARCSAAGIEPVNEMYAICRLGEQVNRTGVLSKAAMDRTLQAVAEMKQIADQEGVETLLVTATSAVRDAANRSEFLVRCRETLNVFPQVLSGREEAHLTYLGATYDLPPGQAALIFDVGGGSTEIAYGTREVLVDAHSLDLGCVRLMEAFDLHLGHSSRRVQAAIRHVQEVLSPLVPEVQAWTAEHHPAVIACGGTATTYAAILLKQMVYDRTQINAVASDSRQLSETLNRLGRMSLTERQQVAGMEKDRAEVLPAGLIIFNAIFERLKIGQFRVTGNGLRTGLLRHYLEDNLLP
jgi:exopolyphosphatase/guanosine-5'-triphosphate,3'-diphosphate pyrophosphatase